MSGRESASDVLEEYLESIGGRDKVFEDVDKALKTKKRGRQPGSSTPNAAPAKRSRKNGTHPADTTPPASAKEAEWKVPTGSWEDAVESIDACQDEEKGDLIIYLTWKNGKKTQHPKEVIYRRCPQKVGVLLLICQRRTQHTDMLMHRCFASTNVISASREMVRSSHLPIPHNEATAELYSHQYIFSSPVCHGRH